ncbi:TPA: hypothetical protein ACH3X2_000715 [Trebouxia sp. C0005]
MAEMQKYLTVKQTTLLARKALLESGHGKRKTSEACRQAALLGHADTTVYLKLLERQPRGLRTLMNDLLKS